MIQVCKSSLILRPEEAAGNDEKYDGSSQCEERVRAV